MEKSDERDLEEKDIRGEGEPASLGRGVYTWRIEYGESELLTARCMASRGQRRGRIRIADLQKGWEGGGDQVKLYE